MLYAAELTWNGRKGVEGEYQQAINRIGRTTLGAFQSTPLGIVAAESGLTPASALLNHFQARFSQRLHARPIEGGGPEEVLARDRSALATRLQAAAALRRGETVESQQWGTVRRFPGRIIVESRAGVQNTASGWGQHGDTIWTDGSRLDSRDLGAACVWRPPMDNGWTGRRFHLGSNKEAYQARRVLDQRQEKGHEYTIFADSTSAIVRVRTDVIGPGQRFAIAAMEVCDRVITRQNTVAIRWVPAHLGIQGKPCVCGCLGRPFCYTPDGGHQSSLDSA